MVTCSRSNLLFDKKTTTKIKQSHGILGDREKTTLEKSTVSNFKKQLELT